jgi:hypothetical protein
MYIHRVTRDKPMPIRIASVRILTLRRSNKIANIAVAVASSKGSIE